MRTETKVMQVANSPSEINAINASQALWGWSVLSVQITDRKTVYDGDTTGYVDELGLHATTQRITETANYATITYVRDPDDPNTPELRRLEQEYENQTVLAAMCSCTSTDDSYLSYWPEEQAWYQEYLKKQQKKKETRSTVISSSIVYVPFLFIALYVARFSIPGALVVVALIALILGVSLLPYRKSVKALEEYAKDPQIHARLEQVNQHIEEGRVRRKAEYNEAMAARAAMVRQAQAITGV